MRTLIAKSLIEHSETFQLRRLNVLNTVEIAGASGGNEQEAQSLREVNTGKDFCSNCHQITLVRQGGCNECEAFGFSKC